MTEPTAGDPFAAPPAAKSSAPLTPPGYSAPAAPQVYPTPYPAANPAPYPPGPQAYPAPDGYYPYGYPQRSKPKTWLNITSLCVVAAGLFIPFFANVAGIVFGHLGRSASRRGEADYAGVGLAGLILNYIGAVLWILGIVAYFAFFAWVITDCANDPYCSGSATYGG